LSTRRRADRLLIVQLIIDPASLEPFAGCVFVPTMGALHAGHGRLIEAAVARREPGRAGVVVSVFVNPTQFNDPKDLERYPRTLDADLRLCEAAGASAVFAPTVEAVYPRDARLSPPTATALPGVATLPGLDDAHRRGHFAGVCQVVKRLFELVRPRAALFGEKDWQQLQVIAAMTRGDGLGVEIVPVPTVREKDGLAMSSRNMFLTREDRVRARSLSEALCAANGEGTVRAAEERMRSVLEAARVAVEYAVVRDAETLMPLGETAQAGRALIAARVGSVRLIDNAGWRAKGA